MEMTRRLGYDIGGCDKTRPRETAFPQTRLREGILGTFLQPMAYKSNIENDRLLKSVMSVL